MGHKGTLLRFLDSRKEESLDILEVGVAQCATGLKILKQYPNFTYTGIDKWEFDKTLKYENNKLRNWNSQEKWDSIYNTVLETTREFGDRCQIIRECSREFLPTYDNKFDVIHIDGDHSEEGAYQDIIMCKNLLKEGGVIWMDDINLKDIKNAINRFIEEYPNEFKMENKEKIIKL